MGIIGLGTRAMCNNFGTVTSGYGITTCTCSLLHVLCVCVSYIVVSEASLLVLQIQPLSCFPVYI